MDAVKFLMERNRMLTSGFATPIIGGTLEREEKAEQIVRTVERWSEEHPRKTLLSELLKRWPAVKRDDNGIPLIYPCIANTIQYKLPFGGCEKRGVYCEECRKEYWLQEVE